jgi:hypothetical protein
MIRNGISQHGSTVSQVLSCPRKFVSLNARPRQATFRAPVSRNLTLARTPRFVETWLWHQALLVCSIPSGQTGTTSLIQVSIYVPCTMLCNSAQRTRDTKCSLLFIVDRSICFRRPMPNCLPMKNKDCSIQVLARSIQVESAGSGSYICQCTDWSVVDSWTKSMHFLQELSQAECLSINILQMEL